MSNRTEMVRPIAMEAPLQKVVVVCEHPDIQPLIDAVLDAGHYDVVLVDSTKQAYSQIKHMAPGLVILCLAIDDLGGFQLLSMLRLDRQTREIRVVICMIEREDMESENDSLEPYENVLAPRQAILTN